ncbi:hypothetical protein Prudu_009322 [Prunus dulcis]|uniref:F-box family protein with DUF295 n=1 Tax=Prunus dulcis TaxID=3755 RepID=A0A4Y1R6H5_PRUDU|nr:hypothetical protein Prudu_009322 [Prunus dulcis]
MSTRCPIEPQEGPSRGPASSDQHFVSALDFASRVSGRSDRECQDLRLGRLGVPIPARICCSADSVSRDLPGLAARVDLVSSRPAGRSG